MPSYQQGQVRLLDSGRVVYGPTPPDNLPYDSHYWEPTPPQWWPYHDEWFAIPSPNPGAPPNTHIVAGNQWEMPIIVRARITASAAVANRVPILAFGEHLQTPNFLMEVQQPSNVTAGQIVRFSWGKSLSPAGGVLGNVMNMSMPDFIQSPGNYWAIQVNAIDIADQLDQCQALVRCWPSRPAPLG